MCIHFRASNGPLPAEDCIPNDGSKVEELKKNEDRCGNAFDVREENKESQVSLGSEIDGAESKKIKLDSNADQEDVNTVSDFRLVSEKAIIS